MRFKRGVGDGEVSDILKNVVTAEVLEEETVSVCTCELRWINKLTALWRLTCKQK